MNIRTSLVYVKLYIISRRSKLNLKGILAYKYMYVQHLFWKCSSLLCLGRGCPPHGGVVAFPFNSVFVKISHTDVSRKMYEGTQSTPGTRTLAATFTDRRLNNPRRRRPPTPDPHHPHPMIHHHAFNAFTNNSKTPPRESSSHDVNSVPRHPFFLTQLAATSRPHIILLHYIRPSSFTTPTIPAQTSLNYPSSNAPTHRIINHPFLLQ